MSKKKFTLNNLQLYKIKLTNIILSFIIHSYLFTMKIHIKGGHCHENLS